MVENKDMIIEMLQKEISKEIEENLLNEIKEELKAEIEEEIKVKIKERLREELEEEIKKRVNKIKKEILLSIKEFEKEEVKEVEEKIEKEEFERLNINLRIQHVMMFSSVLILIFTGLPLKFHGAPFANIMISIAGGIEFSRILHRIGAAGLIFVGLYHIIYLLFFKEGRRNFIELFPRLSDMLNLIKMIKYFIGLSDEKPKFGRFSYIEKFDYWAVYWGMVIMIGSGSILWFNEISMRYLPKYFVDIAREAHSDEGLLATLAITIWHFYNVHLNPTVFPMSWTWWTGKISREEMVEHHPLEYERIMRDRDRENG